MLQYLVFFLEVFSSFFPEACWYCDTTVTRQASLLYGMMQWWLWAYMGRWSFDQTTWLWESFTGRSYATPSLVRKHNCGPAKFATGLLGGDVIVPSNSVAATYPLSWPWPRGERKRGISPDTGLCASATTLCFLLVWRVDWTTASALITLWLHEITSAIRSVKELYFAICYIWICGHARTPVSLRELFFSRCGWER